MALHNKIGAEGEEYAVNYLTGCGYIILHRNWRHHHKELDIVAMDGEKLVFIEVKTRSSSNWEDPSDTISNSKIKYLADVGEAYIYHYNRMEEARFDVLILIKTAIGYEAELIKEAFHP